MNRGDIVAMLEMEALKRPIVAELLARAHSLSDADIETAQVPLKWYKDALRQARDRQKSAQVSTHIKQAAESDLSILSLMCIHTPVNYHHTCTGYVPCDSCDAAP